MCSNILYFIFNILYKRYESWKIKHISIILTIHSSSWIESYIDILELFRHLQHILPFCPGISNKDKI